MSHEIVPTALAINSLRNTGYKNTAYAVAELMDNAVQAGANRVEMICLEDDNPADPRDRYCAKQIAILDNGCGMDKAILRDALQIGNGTRLGSDKHTGIGRFGMGLPMSSISQCRRVDVYSWQNGIESALHTYLDLGEIEAEGRTQIPEPVLKAPDERLLRIGRAVRDSKSGTIVVWSSLDRCRWKMTSSLFIHSEPLIGRIYRRQLAAGTLTIRFVRSRGDAGWTPANDELFVKPTDPGYLMANTTCPPPFADKPMFKLWAKETIEVPIIAMENGREVLRKHNVVIRFSIAKDEARLGFDREAGNELHGKHAAQNVGVSLMRADRELDLDENMISRSTTATERWWGVEVEFPPALDEVFGVTYTKQSATNFSSLARSSELDGVKTIDDLRRLRATQSGDPQAALFEVVWCVEQNLRKIRNELAAQTKGARTDNAAPVAAKPTPEKTGSAVTQVRQEKGHTGQSDAAQTASAPARVKEVANSLKDLGMSDEKADETAEDTIRSGYKYQFVSRPLDSSAFFSVQSTGGVLLVILNTTHPAHDKLITVLTDDTRNATPETLRNRLADATDGLKLLLEAWARFEDEQPVGGPDQKNARIVRERWGEMAEQFLGEA